MNVAQAVALARQGDARGYSWLYEATCKSKYYVALKYTQDPQAAQDVLQEAYVRAFSHLEMLKDPAAFSAWLGVIVGNVAKSALIKKHPTSFSDMGFKQDVPDDSLDVAERIPDEARGPEEQMSSQEAQQIVRELIDTLPDAQRVCVIMYYFEELPIAAIAQSLSCSESTIKTRLRRGRAQIQEKAEELRRRGVLVALPWAYLLRALKIDAFEATKTAWCARATAAVKTVLEPQLGGVPTAPTAANPEAQHFSAQQPVSQNAQVTRTGSQAEAQSATGAQPNAHMTARRAAGSHFAEQPSRHVVQQGVKLGFIHTTAGKALVSAAATLALVSVGVGGYAVWAHAQQNQQAQAQSSAAPAVQAPPPQQVQQQPANQSPDGAAANAQAQANNAQSAPAPAPVKPSEAEQKAQAIKDAKAQGYAVYEGHVELIDGHKACQLADYPEEAYQNGNSPELDKRYAVFMLDTPQDVIATWGDPDSADVEGYPAKMILLGTSTDFNGKDTASRWKGNSMTVIGVPADGSGTDMATDISIPAGQPRITSTNKIKQVWPKE